MTNEQAVTWFQTHPRFSSGAGLARMRRLMELLGNPQERLRFVHIAGTNGKGSTAVMTAAALTAAGYRTGLTISPYILNFRERIQIDGQMIPPQELADTANRIRPLVERVGDMVGFEVVTAAAFDYFARQGCEIVVAEVGIGGRLDATNVIPAPLAAAITSISLDHTEILGDSIEKIAVEKCGIIKPGSIVVAAPGQAPEAIAVIRAACAAAGCPLSEPDMEGLAVISQTLEGSRCLWRGQEFFLPLAGRHQQKNLLSVLALCEALRQKGFIRLTDAAAARGIAGVAFPARFERILPDVYLDGAHNTGGALALAETLALTDQKPVGVIGMLEDKDSTGALRQLCARFSHLYCTAPQNPRALAPGLLARRAGTGASVCGSLREALQSARAHAARENSFVVVWGSLYLAAEAREILTSRGGDTAFPR